MSVTKKKSVRQSSTYPKATKSTPLTVVLFVVGLLQVVTQASGRRMSLLLLYTLAQTVACRRKVLTAIYGNRKPCKS